MDSTVDVTIPVDAEAAKAQSIADAKREARASGLTDEEIDVEIEAWRAERQA